MKQKLALILSAVLVLSMTACKKDNSEQSSQPTPTPVPVQTDYSAPMLAQSETKVYSEARGEIIECDAQVGDFVEAGALLYKIDDNGLYDSIATARNAVEKAQLTLGTSLENEENLNIYAPSSGVIKNLTVKEGERVNTGTLAKIVNEKEFTARVPFNSEQIKSIKVGMNAQIISDRLMSGVSARVTRIYSERNTSVDGAILYDVEFVGTNPGTINEGMTVSAVVGGISSPVSGYIDESDGVAVVSRASGNAGAIRVKDGSYVSKGTLIMTIENSNVTASARRAKIDVEDLQIKLRSLENDAQNLNITAPVSGTIIEKNKELRDSIASKSDSVMTIADTSVLKMTVNTADGVKLPEIGSIVTISYDGGTADGTVTDISGNTVSIDIVNNASIAPNTIGSVHFN